MCAWTFNEFLKFKFESTKKKDTKKNNPENTNNDKYMLFVCRTLRRNDAR